MPSARTAAGTQGDRRTVEGEGRFQHAAPVGQCGDVARGMWIAGIEYGRACGGSGYQRQRSLLKSRRHEDVDPSRRRARPCRPRLAALVPHVLVRGLLRPRAHGLPRAARDQRGPRPARAGLRHALAPRHGDHLVRARGRARAQGQHGDQLDHPARATCSACPRAPASRTASSTPRAPSSSTSCRSGSCPSGPGGKPGYEQKAFPEAERKGQAAAGRVARRARRVGDDPPGRQRCTRGCCARARRCGTRWRRGATPGCTSRAGRSSSAASSWRRATRSRSATRAAWSCPAAIRRKCCSSISRDARVTRLHLVDGTYELYRAHFAPRPDHRAPAGWDAKATVGVVASLLALLNDADEAVTHIAVAFDNPIRSFRNDLFAAVQERRGRAARAARAVRHRRGGRARAGRHRLVDARVRGRRRDWRPARACSPTRSTRCAS